MGNFPDYLYRIPARARLSGSDTRVRRYGYRE